MKNVAAVVLGVGIGAAACFASLCVGVYTGAATVAYGSGLVDSRKIAKESGSPFKEYVEDLEKVEQEAQ